MPCVVLTATNPEEIDTLVEFVQEERAARLRAYTRGPSELVIEPKVQSRVSYMWLQGITPELWPKLKERLASLSLRVRKATDYLWDESQTKAIDP